MRICIIEFRELIQQSCVDITNNIGTTPGFCPDILATYTTEKLVGGLD